MAIWGFKQKADAQVLKGIATQRRNPAEQVSQRGDYGGRPDPTESVIPVRRNIGPIWVKTPSAGIDPPNGSGTLQSATCDLYEVNSSNQWADSGEDRVVWNGFSSAIAGNTLILCHRSFGRWMAGSEDCPGVVGPTNP